MRTDLQRPLLPDQYPPPDKDPPEGTRDQAARQEVTSYRDPPPDRMRDDSENITLPQTSFVDGNNRADGYEV